jgi:hypothetical protein
MSGLKGLNKYVYLMKWKKNVWASLSLYEVCISLVERKDADSKKCRKKKYRKCF